MTRTLFEIVIILLGLIVGSLATIDIGVIPTQISYITNQDAHVVIKGAGGSYFSTSFKNTMSLLPVHEENGRFYFSSTLSTDDLEEITDFSNYQYYSSELKLDKATDNAYLQVDVDFEGTDEANKALKVLFRCDNKDYYLDTETPSVITDVLLTTKPKAFNVYVWYELTDEDCTVDNLNAATGTNVKVEMYAYVKE